MTHLTSASYDELYNVLNRFQILKREMRQRLNDIKNMQLQINDELCRRETICECKTQCYKCGNLEDSIEGCLYPTCKCICEPSLIELYSDDETIIYETSR